MEDQHLRGSLKDTTKHNVHVFVINQAGILTVDFLLQTAYVKGKEDKGYTFRQYYLPQLIHSSQVTERVINTVNFAVSS